MPTGDRIYSGRVSDEFPRQYARTQRFTLGEPRDLSVSPDGQRVVFLRSGAGDDPANSLWMLEVTSGREQAMADPRVLLGGGDPASGELTDEERARRERTRDGSTGITAYATDRACELAAFALNGRLFVADLQHPNARAVVVDGPVHDPRPDPTAHRIAYVSGSALRVADLDGSSRIVAGGDCDDGSHVTWGGADFIAAEEMRRFRGYWWSPDGTSLAVCRVDDTPVGEWTIADPANPARPARTVRYPAAGTANPDVTLHVTSLDGERTEVRWDRAAYPYLAHVDWTDDGLLLFVQSRDQRSAQSLLVDVFDGSTAVLVDDEDDAWVENVPGVPRLLPGGALLHASDRDGVRRLYVDHAPVTPPDLQVRAVVAVGGPGDDGPRIAFTASDPQEPTEIHVWSTTPGADPDDPGFAGRRLTRAPGVHSAVTGGSTTVLRSTTLDRPGAVLSVLVGDSTDGPTISSFAETPSIVPNVTLLKAGTRELSTAVLFPTGRDPDDDTKLPVLLDPYGGPHAQRVLSSHNAFVASQWFADQGFAVVIADGRGSPGRGAEWERAIRLDLANPPLDDQVDALHGAADRYPALDLDRVAIRGWSFGGYLAALAVLKRPDVFHAAIAGAPVTEWRLYDTHYTERYLGDPGAEGGTEVYDASSLLPLAPLLTRPLLLIHGLADDNVVAAHSLQLSSALLAAGRPHEVLPLVGVSHMTPQEVVAENLLRHQLDFLDRSLVLDLEGSTR